MFQKPKPKPWYTRWRGTIAGVTTAIAAILAFANSGIDFFRTLEQYLPASISVLIPGSKQISIEKAVEDIIRQRYISNGKIEEVFGKVVSSMELTKTGSKITAEYYDGQPGQIALVFRDGKVIAWTYAPSYKQKDIQKFIEQSGLDYNFTMKELADQQPLRNFAVYDGSRSQEFSAVQFSDGNPYWNDLYIYWFIFSPRTPCFKGRRDGIVTNLSDTTCSNDTAKGAFQALTRVYDIDKLSRKEMSDVIQARKVYAELTSDVSDVELMPIDSRLKAYRGDQ